MAGRIVKCPSCATKNRVPVAANGYPRCPKCRTDLPWLVDADDADFARAVDSPALVIVDLWAPWCGPCRMIAPVLEKLSAEFVGQLKVVKVNVDNNPMTAQKYNAQSIPMLLLMRGGEVIDTIVGAQPEHVLRATVRSHL